MDPNLEDVLKKKAFGFSYTEETVEYEVSKSKSRVYCSKRNRLYLKNGFVKVKKVNSGIDVILCKGIAKTPSKLKSFKFFAKS